jgi:hypothetical protein
MLLHLTLVAQLASGAGGPCRATTAPALDHTIIAVQDLDAASDTFRRAGFRIKPGRLHANGLLNGHIKFPDGTEIELMTVRGTPGDDMARRYAELLKAGDGGVYVALKLDDIAGAEPEAKSLGLGTRRSASGPWRFLGFVTPSPAAAVFFTSGGTPAVDDPAIFQHEPHATALTEVWLEGGDALGDLLRRLGSRSCGEASGPDGRKGQRWALRNGTLVLVTTAGTDRPRVLGAVLETSGKPPATVRPIPQFWIGYRAR